MAASIEISTLNFFTIPVFGIIRVALTVGDFYTDVVVLKNWFDCGHLCSTWAWISISSILFMTLFLLWRGFFLTVEKYTFEIWDLHLDTPTNRMKRMLICGFHQHYIIIFFTTMKWWYKAFLVRRELGKVSQEGSKTPSLLPFYLKKIEDIETDNGWWKSNEIFYRSLPQLCLQGYVVFLTRDFSTINIVSLALSIASASYAFIGIYNNVKLGGCYFNICETKLLLPYYGLFTYCVGALGLRISIIVLLILINPICAVAYGLTIFVTNQIATWALIFKPNKIEGKVMITHAMDDVVYAAAMKGTMEFYAVVYLAAIGGYGFLNLIVPIPGLVLYGWRARYRKLVVVANVLTRFIECVCGVVTFAKVPNSSPCTQDSNYLSCNGCCRGPVNDTHAYIIFSSFAILYLFGFFIWWPVQSQWLSISLEWTSNRGDRTAHIKESDDPKCSANSDHDVTHQ